MVCMYSEHMRVTGNKGFAICRTWHAHTLEERKKKLSNTILINCIVLILQLRSEGKDYIVQEGDVMLFRFNV